MAGTGATVPQEKTHLVITFSLHTDSLAPCWPWGAIPSGAVIVVRPKRPCLAPDGSDNTHSPNWGTKGRWTGILAAGLKIV